MVSQRWLIVDGGKDGSGVLWAPPACQAEKTYTFSQIVWSAPMGQVRNPLSRL